MNNFRILFLLLLGYPQLFGQYTEAVEYGIKGKIKSVISFRYELIQQNDIGEWAPTKKENYFSKTERYFNTLGRLDSFFVGYYYMNKAKPRDYTFSARTYYSYKKNGEKSALYYFNLNDGEKKEGKFTYEWISPYQYIETSFFDNRTASKTICYLSRSFCDSLVVRMDYEGDSIIGHTEQLEERDLNNHLIKMEVFDKLKDTVEITVLEYKNFDQYGNAEIICQFEGNSRVPQYIYCRRFEYYK